MIKSAEDFQPFDKVLVKDMPNGAWYPTFVSYSTTNEVYIISSDREYTSHVIPYDLNTKHLTGLHEDCPDIYKWWERN